MELPSLRKHVALYMFTTLIILVAGVLPVLAGSLYTDISLSYYNRFFDGLNTQNFQRYHVLRAGYQTDTFDANINFNMFEDVAGPLADHNINPFTLETTWQTTDQDEIQVNCLYLTDVYDKRTPFVEATLESKYKHSWPWGDWQFSLIPTLRLNKLDKWSPAPSLGAEATYRTPQALWSLKLNGLDLKDYAIFSRGTNVLTAEVRWPTWKDTEMSIGLNALLGQPAGSPLPHGLHEHQETVWVNISIFFDHLAKIWI